MKKFIYGLLTGLILIPLSDELMNIIYSWIEVLKIKPAKLVLEGNEELTELQERQEPTDTPCIGFQYNPIDEEDDYNE